ncbi:MAG: filamentous hemagglutinin N-terminal domain-containing protein, partial [Gammaproteobacteria bacterium]
MHRSLKRGHHRTTRFLTFCYALAASAVAGANPRGAEVVHGSASFAMPNPHTLEVTNSPSAILNWQSFSIGAGETTRFIQDSAASAVLNRVVGGSSSEILGNLLSNGRVFLINEAGILIGRDAVVDTAGLVLSTLDIDDADFLGGRLHFEGDADNGGITNHGYIKSAPGGEIILIAPRIVNEAQVGNPVSGLIESPEGDLVLAAGTAITIASLDHPDITFEVSAPENEAVNLGRLLAAGGSVSVLAGTLHHSGEINADAITRDSAGNVVLAASGDVHLDSGSRISASGEGSAGTVAVSAGDEGRIYALGSIAADGDTGGSVALEADRVLAAGAVSAHGVIDGGEVEVSATTEIIATASARLDAASDSGRGGRVALDGGANVFSSALVVADGLTGGEVEVLGDEVTLASATIDASGQAGGGRVRVGGGFQGGEGLPAAQAVTANASTVIKADATAAGDGGSVVVWADGTTRFDGIVSAHGGAASGDGGEVEISGKEALAFAGRVDVGAPNGAAGSLLLDPKNITFSAEEQGPGSFQLLDPHPGANNNFGQTLQNFFEDGDFSTPAKIAVFDPLDDFGGADAGAVYLYRASDGALLSALTGSHAGDNVGSATLQSIAGAQVLRTPTWHSDRGAVTVFDVVNGVNGAVSASNSLVGANAGDEVGLVSGLFSGVQSLGTSIAVRSSGFSGDRGALTVAMPAALKGTVGTGNSLVGANPGDELGVNALQSIGGGNYILRSAHGGNGAVTFINPANAPRGVVSSGNSLVGAAPGDDIGSNGVQNLGSAYAVLSPDFNGAAGAVTIASSATGIVGIVGAGNSLVGSASGDDVGGSLLQNLFFGRYALVSDMNGAGAVTLVDPTAPPVGVVSAANSLVGDSAGDEIGSAGLDYVGGTIWAVFSPGFDDGATTDVGAVTLVDGQTGSFAGTATPATAAVGAANSLVGVSQDDAVGSDGIEFVTSSLYAVLSPGFDNGAAVDAGAITWYTPGDSLSGSVGVGNSLLGANTGDDVGGGSNDFYFLPSGNGLIEIPDFDGGAGALVFVDPSAPVTGAVGAASALVGGTPGDALGSAGIEIFDDYYLVLTPGYDDGVNGVNA